MRLIRGLVVVLGIVVGTLLLFLNNLAYSYHKGESQETQAIRAMWGMRVNVLWLVACALLLPAPAVAAVLFTIVAWLFVEPPLPLTVGDNTIWGLVSLGLAAFSCLSWWLKRKSRLAATRSSI